MIEKDCEPLVTVSTSLLPRGPGIHEMPGLISMYAHTQKGHTPVCRPREDTALS